MKTLSLTAAVLVLAFSATAMAQTPTPSAHPHDFASRKAAALAKIDERVAALTTARACVAAAQAPADMKMCHAQAKASMHEKQPA